jgi:hypothetical protein
MTTKTKPKSQTPKPKAKAKPKKAKKTTPAPSDPRPLYDSRSDEDAVEGHFVDVVSGDHKGDYGVFLYSEGETAIVKSLASGTFSTPISNLRPALVER